MEKIPCVVIFCVVILSTLTNGAVVSPEVLNYNEFISLNTNLETNLNLTTISINKPSDHPHIYLDIVGIIKLYNYSVEVHHVETDDGYILEMHRITGNKNNPSPDGKPAVLIMHGVLASATDWVVAGPKRGLGFILADQGYDVWMGNCRGSKYSRTHTNLTTVDPEYWNFSWHEIGVHDVPSMIDYILQQTGQKKIYYIGHSQGSTVFLVMASQLPEYNDKIHVMFSIAPVAYCSRMFSPIFQFFSRFATSLDLITSIIGKHEFKPTNAFFKRFTTTYCKNNMITQLLCKNIVFMIGGFNENQIDTDLMPAVLAHIPAGSSVKQFLHYAQIIRSGKFEQYDHGPGNVAKYRSRSPPLYNLKNVKVPIFLHYSANDWISDVTDVNKLYSELPKAVGKIRVPHDKFTHLDYLWGKDVKALLYDKIVSLMSRYP